MVEVLAVYDTPHYTLTSKGHATGSDKACAAVSSIMYALGGWVLNHRAILPHADVTLGKGDAKVYAVGGSDLQAAFETAVLGLMQVAKSEPERVKVKVSRREP